ncbi:nuclear receptor corepressor 1-like [Centruroides sculpturatus]|uniref:nuclear receptor corepressor 1-like n=1 Tax=Centruroides sculpturatus TaxID=218467 RepID=UPI000C6E86AD|nr:nuclear receptor corepressor 1-like [Centruroides sculpturatus]
MGLPATALSSSGLIHPASRSGTTNVGTIHTQMELDHLHHSKRPRLCVEPKAPLHQPLVIDTRDMVEVKKEPAYTPQVEAISPTLPTDELQQDLSPHRSSKDELLQAINRIDREINQVETQTSKLKKRKQELEAEANKPPDTKQVIQEISTSEPKQMSIAQIIYSENRKKAQQAHALLEKLGPKVDLPMYNQPMDTQIHHENKKKFATFKKSLIQYFKRKHQERQIRENYLTDTYSQFMQVWLKKIEKKENNANRRAKEAKVREFFEKQFPELKKQREDKERFSRVGQRIRSDAELEEIMDGLQEQEMEDKKMRSYAVIPPILLDSKQQRLQFINRNGLVEDPMAEYKERQMLNIWTDQEKEIFREKYLQHSKNFGLIATYLERKSVADCVQYYYLTKKSENYKQMLRKHNVRKRTRTLVKPQSQAHHNQTGITTRQQDEAKPISTIITTTTSVTVTTTSASTTSTVESVSTTTSDVNVTNLSSSITCITTNGNINSDSTKIQNDDNANSKSEVRNNIENGETTADTSKKKSLEQEKDKGDEGGDELSDDNELPNEISGETGGVHPCAVCKIELENFGQSRPLTKSNCDQYGIKENELTTETRVCSSCRFKSVRRRCPIPTCKTPKRKVKRLRPLPSKWSEVSAEVREPIIAELQIPAEVNKCCSACFNRIARKLGTHSISDESTETSRWTEEEMEIAKRGLREYGTDWKSISDMVQSKTKEQCKNFYFNYKRKLGLEDIIREYREVHGKDNSLSTVTDEESGETTSSCEEENCVDNCTSDTASAPSPDNKMLDEISEKDCSRPNLIPTLIHKEQVCDTNDGPRLETCHSPRNVPDYDSSATVSADEGQGLNENDGSTTSTQLASSETSRPQSGNGNENANQIPGSGNSCISFSVQPKDRLDGSGIHESSYNIPLVKTLLQDPVIGTIPHEIIASHHSRTQAYHPSPQDGKSQKDEPTCVRDLIYQAIEMSLQSPVKPGKSTTPITSSSTLQSIVNREREKDMFSREASQEIKDEIGEHANLSNTPPAAHKASRPHYSVTRPEGLMAQYAHHMNREPDMEILDYEVQDLSRKDKPRDKNYSPPREYGSLKRERIVTNVRPPSELGYSTSHSQFSPYGGIPPPPAHSNYSRTNRLLPPPDLSPQYTTEPREVYYSRSNESHGKTSYNVPDQLHSQPPQLIAQPPTPVTPATPPPSRILPKSAKCNVPPPPPLITSSVKSTPLSPKLPYKEKLMSHPPPGSITQGTPVNQHLSSASNNINHSQSVSRHDNFLGHPTAHMPKESGSITLGTPLSHDSASKRGMSGSGRLEGSVAPTPTFDGNSRNPVTASEGLPRPGLRVMYDPNAIENYYRRMSPTGPYSYPQSFTAYSSPQQTSRSAYHCESQLSSKQIMIDFNTSKQMQMRRGSNSEKEARISPRAHENNPHPPLSGSSTPDPRIFSVYTNVPYPSNTSGVPFPGQGSVYFPVGDSRFHHHSSSPIVQIDRTHSPGNESQISPNTSWPSPVSKQSSVHSPGLQQGHVTPRQNVIQRSITWGTAKPSVIQTPTSASPRSLDMRTEPISPVPPIRKGAPSPRHPPPGTYSINPSSHDAFNTLVNAAAAQPSLVVPKEEKRSPIVSSPNMHMHSEITRSPRERSTVEGLEKSLLDMHKRPRSYSESGQSIIANNSREKYRNEREHGRASVEGLPVDGERERIIIGHSNIREEQHYLVETGPNTDYDHNNLERLTVDLERPKMGITESTSSLRLSNAREPFTREQFEKQMRQPNYGMSRSSRERGLSQNRKEDENRPKYIRMDMVERPTTSTPYTHQNELDNEASRIFSQSFQKDHQKPTSTQHGFTAANLIDAIITHQINQTAENPGNNKNAAIDNLFQRQQSESDARQHESGRVNHNNGRQEVVTIDDEPPINRERYNRERPSSHNHNSPIAQDSFACMTEKNITLGERIAAIISKDFSSSNDIHSAQSSYSHNRIAVGSSMSPASSNRASYQSDVCHVLDSHHHNRPLEGIAASLPAEGLSGTQSSPMSEPDHSLQNCSGSACSSHSWKLRRALQQDRDREHQSPGCADTSSISHQPTQVAGNVMNQDERQIIRVAQSGSPCIQSSHSSRSSRTSPVTPYAVEPISPPNQPSSDNIISNNSRVISASSTTSGDNNSFPGHPSNRTSAWVTNPGITGLLTTRRLYQHESSESSVSVSSSVVHSSNIPTCIGNLGPSISNRPPHQQQIGLSPLDYVKNRIVEVMRTATDENNEIHESVRKGIPSSSQSVQKEEKDQSQNIRYNSLNNYDNECPSENIRETMTPQSSQRYSPAVTPVSFIPTPPRPSSAVDSNPGRISVMADSSHLYKHNLECVPHNSDWKDVRISRIRPRSASPSSTEITTKELEETSRKKSRLESHYIPESSTEKNNLPLPESSENAHSSTTSGHLEPPQLASFGEQNENNNYISESHPSPPISSNGNDLSRSASPSELHSSQSSRREGERSTVESSTYCETKGENQWEVTSGVGDDRTTTDCISHIVDSPASGEMVIDESSNINSASSSQIEPVSPPTQETISTSGNIETRDQVGSSSSTGNAQVGSTNGSLSLSDPSQSGPVTSTQGQNSRANTPLSSGVVGPGCYSPYSSSVSSTSISSSSPIYSSSSMTPSVSSSQHIPYSNFSRNTPYPYAYSALSVRSLAASAHQCGSPSSTQNPNSSLSCASSHIQSSAVSGSSSSSNSPSSLSRENQPAPILSSQYEPLSDED